MQPKKMRMVSERLYFTCWHFYDPEKDLGATLAAGLFVQQPTTCVLVATWYVIANFSLVRLLTVLPGRSGGPEQQSCVLCLL